MIEKSYKYRLYPNKEQQQILEQHFGAMRWIFNYGLNKKIEAYQKNKKPISCFDISKELPKLKEIEETKWLKNINAQSLQMSLRQLDNAFVLFFKKQNRFPNFKNKKGKNSFSIPQGNKIDWKNKKAKFIKIGEIKIKTDKQFTGRIIKATISKNKINQYFVSYIIDENIKILKPKTIEEKTTIGIDLGIATFATLSDGKKIENPKYLTKSEQRIKVLQKRLSKKQKGSNRRKKAIFKVSKLHNKVKNQRSCFLHNLTYQLTHDNQVDSIAIEKLSIDKMMKNHRLAKSISDVSWNEFVRQLTYKCKWYGKNLLTIGRFEPSSKMCSCGEINNNLSLSDRNWTCQKCGITHDRDILAANNIKHFALSGRLSPVGVVEVSQ